MAFMSVHSAHDTWAKIDTRDGLTIVPAEFLDRAACESGDFSSCEDYVECGVDEVNGVEFADGWCARLSASGFLDCTEWCGPYDSEDEARAYVRDLYDVG